MRKGETMSPEQREKIAARLRGVPKSDRHRARIRRGVMRAAARKAVEAERA